MANPVISLERREAPALQYFNPAETFPLMEMLRGLFLKSISFLDAASFINLRSSSRSLHHLTKEAACTNPEFMELCVASNLASAVFFREIYAQKIEQKKSTSFEDEPYTLQRVIGEVLFILSHPSQRAKMDNFLQIRDLKTGWETRLKLVIPIESIEVINRPEPTLILAHKKEGIRKVILDQLLQLAKEGDSLDISTLTTVTPHSQKALSLAPTCQYALWDRLEVLREENFSPVINTRNDLIAIAYQDKVIVQNIEEIGAPLIFNFQDARYLALYDDSILCVSSDQWALFLLRRDDEGSSQEPLVRKLRIVNQPLFTFGKRFDNKIVIAQREGNYRRLGIQIGFVYDLESKELKPLKDKTNKGDQYYTLNSLLSYENRLFGASYRYNEWHNAEYDIPVLKNPNSFLECNREGVIHTMEKVAHVVILATSRRIYLHVLNGQFDRTKLIIAKLYPKLKGLELFELDERLITLQVQKRYLITETLKKEYNEERNIIETRRVRVYDLLDSALTVRESEEKKGNE